MKKSIFFLAALLVSAVSMAQTPTVSASKVTMKYCKTTYGTVNIKTNDFPVTKDGYTFEKEGTYVKKMDNARGCDSVVTYVIQDRKGRLDGEFSVASGKRVQFSKGVLQFKSSNGITYPNDGCLKHQTADGEKPGIFQFAATQYLTAGNTHNNSGQGRADDQEWQDIFGRGASGVDNTYPYELSNFYCNDFSGTNYDWGVYNAIENGGKTPGMWRCMTMSEWQYLIGQTCDGYTLYGDNCRANANQKWGWGHITVNYNTVNGLVLLPDDWTLPAGCSWSAQNDNNYNETQWADMEANGAVFIATTGYYQSGYRQDATESYYYTSDDKFYGFDNYSMTPYSKCSNLFGFVRLVMDIK